MFLHLFVNRGFLEMCVETEHGESVKLVCLGFLIIQTSTSTDRVSLDMIIQFDLNN